MRGFKGRLKNVVVDLDGMALQVNLAAHHELDPAVLLSSADPSKPNPIVEALRSSPPASRFTVIIEVLTVWPDSITCPKCGLTSHNMHDIAEGYCGNCNAWTQPDSVVKTAAPSTPAKPPRKHRKP